MRIENLEWKQALADGEKLPFIMLQTVSAVVQRILVSLK